MSKKYQTIDALNQVALFHKTFNAPIEPNPVIPSKERSELRVNLLQEELNELKEAIEKEDIVEVADALCDLQYVLSGAVLEFGLGDKFVELFEEVQRSNMSKACKTEEEADTTCHSYTEKGVDTYYNYNEELNLYVIGRSEDNKVLKSINYSPANLKPILERPHIGTVIDVIGNLNEYSLERLYASDWYKSRPQQVKDLIEVFSPNKLFRFKDSRKECYVIGFETPEGKENYTKEDITLIVEKTGKGGVMDKMGLSSLDTNQVFNVKQEDLEECHTDS